MTAEQVTTLAELSVALSAASDWAQECATAEKNARSAATNAINKLNEAQRAFDAHIAKMKSAAPRDSDWGRNINRAIAAFSVSDDMP